MKPKCLIMAASGERSFTVGQVEELKKHLDTVFLEILNPLDAEEFIRLAFDAEILAMTRRPLNDLDEKIIKSLPNLKALAIYSTGYEWLDLKALREKGILVSYLPDYCTVSVAEHTLAMVLTMSRRTHLSYDKARGIIPDNISLRGFELRGKDIGIIGLGRIGSEVAKMMKALQTNVSFFDIRDIPDPAADYKPRNKLLEESDIVILTCSKMRDEAPVIAGNELSMMKRNAVLINPARSDLVDNADIFMALKEKKLMGYAVDNYIGDFSEGLDYGRILQTGHTAWYSTEAIERGTSQWVENIIGLSGSSPINLI